MLEPKRRSTEVITLGVVFFGAGPLFAILAALVQAAVSSKPIQSADPGWRILLEPLVWERMASTTVLVVPAAFVMLLLAGSVRFVQRVGNVGDLSTGLLISALGVASIVRVLAVAVVLPSPQTGPLSVIPIFTLQAVVLGFAIVYMPLTMAMSMLGEDSDMPELLLVGLSLRTSVLALYWHLEFRRRLGSTIAASFVLGALMALDPLVPAILGGANVPTVASLGSHLYLQAGAPFAALLVCAVFTALQLALGGCAIAIGRVLR